MRRTLPSFLFNPSCLETQSSQVGSSDITTQTLLALLSDFLAERRTELFESREEHIRVKQMKTAQLTINSRVTALEAQQREVTTCQTVLSDDFVVLNDRQNEIAKSHTRIESVLSTINKDISDLQAVLKSINRSDRDESEFLTELRSVRSESVHDLLCRVIDIQRVT
jgi:Na+/phosphate symporter